MSELTNKFSWSFSAAADFEECRRKRYWSKYAMWGGWKDNAPPLQRAAYRLSKMQNGFTLLGNAVEIAVRHAIRGQQEGRALEIEDIYQQAARPFLNNAWKESLGGQWRQNPKKYYCLREHYYRELNDAEQKDLAGYVADHTRRCIANFIASVAPRLAAVKREQEIEVASAAMGDPESFALEGVKIYAIPDYVYRAGEEAHIHDWKAGKPRPQHRDQMLLYAVWAQRKHGAEPQKVRLHLEYLSQDSLEDVPVNAEALSAVIAGIQTSVMDMAEYLDDGDLAHNAPAPKDDWDLALDRDTCRQCNFFELCKPELEA